jgi:hypothetical protein
VKRKAIVSGPVSGPLREVYRDRGPALTTFVGPELKTTTGGRVPPRKPGRHLRDER